MLFVSVAVVIGCCGVEGCVGLLFVVFLWLVGVEWCCLLVCVVCCRLLSFIVFCCSLIVAV